MMLIRMAAAWSLWPLVGSVKVASTFPSGSPSPPPRPTFLLLTGPTGSGKTDQAKQLGMIQTTDGVPGVFDKVIRVDDFIESDDQYRKRMYAGLVKRLKTRKVTSALVDEWLAKDKTTYDFFGELYWGARTEWGCGRVGTGGCYKEFESVLEAEFRSGKNVALEVTGKAFPKRRLHQAFTGDGTMYKTVIGINVVDFCALLDRNSGRAASAIEDFIVAMNHAPRETIVPAPRLPDLSKLASMTDQIVASAEAMIDCVGEGISEQCPEIIDEYYVFDNQNWGQGVLPYVVLKTNSEPTPAAESALENLKLEAKRMVSRMRSKQCQQAAAQPGRAAELAGR